MLNLEGQNTGDPGENGEMKMRRYTQSFGHPIRSPDSFTGSAPAGSHQYVACSTNPASPPPHLEWYTEDWAGNSSRCSSM